MLYGIVLAKHQIRSFSGVWLGGWLYDHCGSYDLAWWLGAAFGLMAPVVHWPIQGQPVWRLATEEAQSAGR